MLNKRKSFNFCTYLIITNCSNPYLAITQNVNASVPYRMCVLLHEEWRVLGEALIKNINTRLFYFMFSYLYSISCLLHCNTCVCSSSRNFWFFHVSAVSRRQEEADTNYRGPGNPEGVLGPTISHTFLSFSVVIIICRLYQLTLSNQAQVTLQLIFSLSDLV